MKVLAQIVLVLAILYVTSYIVLRSRWTHTWDKDGSAYMHFPVSPGWVYHFFRPLSIADAQLSGMKFHIGPHPGEELDEQPAATSTSAVLPASVPTPTK